LGPVFADEGHDIRVLQIVVINPPRVQGGKQRRQANQKLPPKAESRPPFAGPQILPPKSIGSPGAGDRLGDKETSLQHAAPPHLDAGDRLRAFDSRAGKDCGAVERAARGGSNKKRADSIAQ
jgi:hypothetical protein